jgi:hypothetical protein
MLPISLLLELLLLLKEQHTEFKPMLKENFIFKQVKNYPYTLIVSYIGYKKAEVIVDKNPVTINLKEERQELDELVVVGYGSQKRKDITGSVASVPKANLSQVTSSADNLLRGAIPGW